MNEIKKSSVFRRGDAQLVEIPAEFELPEGDVTITREGDRIVIAPASSSPVPETWAEFFNSIDPVDVDWPDVDEGLSPLDDVKL